MSKINNNHLAANLFDVKLDVPKTICSPKFQQEKQVEDDLMFNTINSFDLSQTLDHNIFRRPPSTKQNKKFLSFINSPNGYKHVNKKVDSEPNSDSFGSDYEDESINQIKTPATNRLDSYFDLNTQGSL